MKDWLKPLVGGTIGGLLGGILCLIILAIAYNNSEVFGNVADWLSGVGSVTAIYFVYRQIKQQTDQHGEEKGHDLQIALSNRVIKKAVNSGGIIIDGETEIFFFGTNNGMMPSSFRYIDVYTSENFEILKANHEKSAVDHRFYKDPEGLGLEFRYSSGDTKRKFERVLPGDISEEITIPSKSITSLAEGNSEKLYLVYMDVLGVVYGRPFNIN